MRDSVVVDKSLLVADLFRSGSKATLFCRPRRFGKSLNLSMLHCYFEMAPADSPAEAPENDVFASMAIWDEDAGAFRKHHRAYPVIHLSFNNTKAQTWYEGRRSIEENIVGEYLRHGYLAESTALSPRGKGALLPHRRKPRRGRAADQLPAPPFPPALPAPRAAHGDSHR